MLSPKKDGWKQLGPKKSQGGACSLPWVPRLESELGPLGGTGRSAAATVSGSPYGIGTEIRASVLMWPPAGCVTLDVPLAVSKPHFEVSSSVKCGYQMAFASL